MDERETVSPTTSDDLWKRMDHDHNQMTKRRSRETNSKKQLKSKQDTKDGKKTKPTGSTGHFPKQQTHLKSGDQGEGGKVKCKGGV